MITYGGVGAAGNAAYNAAASPAIPAGAIAGDLLLCLSVARSVANNVFTSSWTTLSIADTGNFYILASYRIAAGEDAAPTITPVGMSSGQSHSSRVTAWHGVDPINPFGPFGSGDQYNSVSNVGPIAAPISIPADGAAVVLGAKLVAWTDVALLTGALTWAEAWDETTVVANAFSWVMDYATWSGGAPALSAKTFVPTGGTASTVIGQMWTLNAIQPPSQYNHRRRISAMPFPPFP